MDSEEKPPLRVAMYLRVSTDDQAEKYGLEAQRSAIEGMMKSRGTGAMVLAGKNDVYVYIDDGESGTVEIKERPAFAQLIEDVINAPEGQKPFDVVAVYKIDRFARKLKILLHVLDFFEKNKIEFISASESIDTSTPFGRAMLGIMGVIAELELETIKDRTTKGRAKAVEQGKYMGTHAPYGYQKDEEGRLKILPVEAKIVTRIFTHFVIDKFSVQKIADILTEEGVLSPEASAVKHKKKKGEVRKLNPANFWRQERIRKILSNEVYTGIYLHSKVKKGKLLPKEKWQESPYRHDGIITRHIYELAQTVLEQYSDRKILTNKKGQDYLYLLSSLLKCDHCRNLGLDLKHEMMGWTGVQKEIGKGSGVFTHSYQCNRKNIKKNTIICPVVPIPADSLEDYIVNFIERLLSNPKQVFDYQRQLRSNKLGEEHIKRLEDSKNSYVELINGLPARDGRLREQHELQMIDTEMLKTMREGLGKKKTEYEKRIDEIDAQLSRAVLSKGYEESLEQFAKKYYDTLESIHEDRTKLYELIHSLIFQIIVHSRPKTENDVIAGRKKEGQMIPDRIDIYLNLPQNLLRELYTQRFEVKNPNLWAGGDLNPHELPRSVLNTVRLPFRHPPNS